MRDGRRNRYELHVELPLRHPRHRHHTVGELIRFLRAPAPQAASGSLLEKLCAANPQELCGEALAQVQRIPRSRGAGGVLRWFQPV